MSNTIALMLSQSGGPPFHSVGYVNHAIGPILTRNGWDVRSFEPPRNDLGEEAMLPYGLAGQLTRFDADAPPHIALFDATGTAARSPARGWARHNAVLYHGLAYGAGAWIANPAVDLHLANSPYLADVLRSLFAFPNWRQRRVLNPRGLMRTKSIRLPLPSVEYPDGHPGFAHGADLPPALLRELDSGATVWGHALQPGKQDWLATLSILYWLNELRTAPLPPIRLFVSEHSLTEDVRRGLDAMLAPAGRSCADYFVRVPHLSQAALFRLMRGCRFGLAYNRFPEPFGFYVLESVHQGCPVYTNGVGNNRHLLPPEHGINVYETFDMVEDERGQRDPGAWRGVAEQVLRDLRRGEVVQGQCKTGARMSEANWAITNFELDLDQALRALDEEAKAEFEFEMLRVELGPTVRGLDVQTGIYLSDYGSGRLLSAAIDAVEFLKNRLCSDFQEVEMQRLEKEFGLFSRGILTVAEKWPR
ncbi:hypothetical protein [Lysobacter enzymogenes]|uniref:hypothetical protein n=1 Tax=Lysobacter enzymogenes TaxID=69 RepID=UPI00089C693D|nr:hypothetical protein [Lysobacter enzymogenes]SDX21384.1 hypothetical protein SAMN05421681_104239 [Lysobacter enzymogenes]